MTTETQSYKAELYVPWYKKLNPLWLLKNDFEPVAPAWYVKQLTDSAKGVPPSARTAAMWWWLRNPFHNFGRYAFGFGMLWVAILIAVCAVIPFGLSWGWLLLSLFFVGGIMDKDHSAYGPAPVSATTWYDMEPKGSKSGWKWCVVKYGILRLPFCSYESSRLTFYAGFQPTGFFGYKWNVK